MTGAPRSPGDGAGILLVDDEPANLLALRAILGDLGNTLVEAGSGEEALRCMRDRDFAVVLLDVQMRGMDGLHTARLIRDQERSRQTPIIFVTAFDSSRAQVVQAYSLGAVDYLIKPIVPEILRAKVAVFVDLFQKSERIRLLEREQFERRLAEEKSRRERTAQAITKVAAEFCSENDAVRKVLEAVCENLAWDAGALWEIDQTGEALCCTEFWRQPAAQVRGFESASRARTFEIGAGLPGRVWATREAVWIRNLAGDNNFPRLEIAAREGLSSALAFPVMAGDEFLGVMEFFSHDARESDEESLRMLVDVGNRFGQFLQRRRAETALTRSEIRKSAILEASLDCIITIDHEGMIVEWNPAAERTFGRRREEVLGREMAELIIPPALREAHRAGIARFLATGDGPVLGRRIEMTALRADGSEFLAELAIVAIPLGGKPLFTGFLRDITDRNQAEASLRESEERYRTLFNSMDEGFCTIEVLFDANKRPIDYRFLDVNAAFERQTGLKDAAGKLMRELAPQHEQHWFDVYGAIALTGVPARFENRAEALRRWYEVNAFRVGRPEERRVAVLFNDITERKRNDAALERAVEEKQSLLESERAARSEAEHAGRIKDEFLATLSHELRTPLNAILGYATLMRISDMDASELEEAAETIERNAQLQAQLIEDLLDMNRIISGKMRLDVQKVDIAAAIGAAINTVRPSAEAKGIRIDAVLDPSAGPVRADPGRIQQIVWNLLFNAVKFTPREGGVQVFLRRVNSRIEITVADTGIGIAPEFLPYVFDRFRQADGSTTRRHGGLGLGLSIVKNLVELHGGTVSAQSPGEGRGATFIVSLPVSVLRDSDAEDGKHRPTSRFPFPRNGGVDLSGVHVLVVDDDPDSTRLVKRVLAECKAEVIEANCARHALALLSESPFQVLISDIGMPEEDGYQLIREVRSLGNANRGIPALALTALARSEDRRRAAMAGFQTHLAKPVDAPELLAIVANLAGRNSQ